MNLVELAPTYNFRIFYDSTLFADNTLLNNATELSRTLDADFQMLANWFGIHTGFGPDHRISVNLVYQGTSGSNNQGYKPNGGSYINLNGAPRASSPALVIAAVRMHLVAELSEIFMSYNNQVGQTTWDSGASHGEGLSQFCAYQISPVGYIDFYGPGFENQWLKSNRTDNDWVNNTEATDGNPLSFGCALLFIFYLHSQLGHSETEIIQNGGATLAETYKKLNESGGAFGGFRGLMDRFFPPAHPDAFLIIVNPFPLIESSLRSVAIEWDESKVILPPRLLQAGQTTVRPAPLCPEATYPFRVEGTGRHLEFVASTYGFGSASFQWSVNGLALTGGAATIQAPITIVETNMSLPTGESSRSTTIPVVMKIANEDTLHSALTLDVGGPFGKYDLVVQVVATEVYNTAVPSAEDMKFGQMDTSMVRWGGTYNADRQRCEDALKRIGSTYVRGASWLSRLFTGPNPPPDLVNGTRALLNLARDLEAVRDAPEHVQRAVETAVVTTLGVSVSGLHALLEHSPVIKSSPNSADDLGVS